MHLAEKWNFSRFFAITWPFKNIFHNGFLVDHIEHNNRYRSTQCRRNDRWSTVQTEQCSDRQCNAQTDGVEYRQTVQCTDRRCSVQTDGVEYRQTVQCTGRQCSVQTDSTVYRQTVQCTGRQCSVQTDSTVYRQTK